MPGLGTELEHDIMQFVGGEEEQTTDKMLDVNEERQEEVFRVTPRRGAINQSSVWCGAFLLTTTESMEGIRFQHWEETISLLKWATTLVNDKYMLKIRKKNNP